ncbi:hypothetical protein NQD34_001321 [Periophthalmus magnuspinnatus]|nr:hypothetical protein NQD34_001321 [Periophthalmus magnuspinnatus]
MQNKTEPSRAVPQRIHGRSGTEYQVLGPFVLPRCNLIVDGLQACMERPRISAPGSGTEGKGKNTAPKHRANWDLDTYLLLAVRFCTKLLLQVSPMLPDDNSP